MQTDVTLEIVRGARCTVTRNVFGARTGNETDRAEAPREQCRIGQVADPYCHIQAFLDQVHFAVVEIEVDLDGRVAVEEIVDRFSQVTQPER